MRAPDAWILQSGIETPSNVLPERFCRPQPRAILSGMTMTIDEVNAAVEGQTLATAFLRTVEEGAIRVALRERGPGDAWVERTFAEYAEHIGRVCASLRAAGVAPGDRVVLMMRNSPTSTSSTWPPCSAAPHRSRSTTRRRPSRSPTSSVTARRRSPWSRTTGSTSGSSRCATSCRPWARSSTSPTNRAGAVRTARHGRPGGAGGVVTPGDARHGHLHVGHHRPAEGRDDQQLQRRVDRRVVTPVLRSRASTSPASASCPTSRWRTSPSA